MCEAGEEVVAQMSERNILNIAIFRIFLLDEEGTRGSGDHTK
jgi:hypothetical protein